MMTYQETTEYLFSQLPQFETQGAVGYKPGLERVEQLLALCGAPHKKLTTIHVAGTNGKGSTSTMLAAILAASGLKVGLFTSPHLVDFRERIRINGVMIPESEVISFVDKMIPLIPEDLKPTFFELTTAMAFDYFARQGVDIAVIEVGMGGRLDSTNVIKPLVSVITNVSIDHAAYLGGTLKAIAGEKAGIIKSGTPLVLGQSSVEDVYSVIKSKADEMGAPLVCADRMELISGYFSRENGGYKVITSDFGTFSFPLSGAYQLENLSTVLQVLLLLRGRGYNIPDESVHTGVGNTKEYGLRGRLEVLQKENPRVIIDTGHNPGAWECLHIELENLNEEGGLVCMIGMAADKDVKEVLSQMPKSAHYILCKAKGARSMPAEQLAGYAKDVGLRNVQVVSDVFSAYKESLKRAEEMGKQTVFVGGSNFVIGELLSQL